VILMPDVDSIAGPILADTERCRRSIPASSIMGGYAQ
jgi:hypothetical protein